MTQDSAVNPNGQPQSQAMTPYQARAMELRENIGQDTAPRAIVPRTFAEAQAFATAIAQSALVPEALRNRAPDVLMMVLAGAELEIPPIRSLSLFHVIEGVPKLSADGLAGKVTSSPLCEYLEPIEQSATRVTWRGKRSGRPEIVLAYTIADADAAGLTGPTRSGRPSNWTKYPCDMLNARCKARLCRLLWPDLCAGLTTAEEALDILADAPPGPTSTFTAPPPPPPTLAAVAAAAKPPRMSKSKPIDVVANDSAGPAAPVMSPTVRDTGSPTQPASSSSNASPSSSAPADTAPVVTPSSSPQVASESPAPAEESSAFGEDEAPPSGRTIEQFEAAVAAAVATKKIDALNALKAEWIPWSKSETADGGKQHAHRMRAAFSKAQQDLGIK